MPDEIKLPPMPSAYSEAGNYIGFGRIDLEKFARAAVIADREGRQQWLPIETAPKGRKLIAGYLNSHGKWRTVMACYYRAGTLPLDEIFDDAEGDDEFAPEGWYEENETHETILPLGSVPTHWQPLPAPPADAQRAKEDV